MVDLDNLGNEYRSSNVIGLNPDGSTLDQFRYITSRTWDLTVTINF